VMERGKWPNKIPGRFDFYIFVIFHVKKKKMARECNGEM
jgi:hypothetical protein